MDYRVDIISFVWVPSMLDEVNEFSPKQKYFLSNRLSGSCLRILIIIRLDNDNTLALAIVTSREVSDR